jgi:hypothetical protein
VIDVNKSHTLEEGAHSPSWPNRLIVIIIILVIVILLLAIMNCGLLGCHPVQNHNIYDLVTTLLLLAIMNCGLLGCHPEA